MRFKGILILFLILFFASFVLSYPIVFDYAHVRTTSNPTYMPYQYAGYYDSIDLAYGIYGASFTSPVNLIVSPKVYGINSLGQRIFVHNIQTHSFMLYPNLVYSYAYNPMFYFDPDYQSYEVVLDLQSTDGSYQSSTNTYVYLDGVAGGNTTPPIIPPSITPTCDDFYVSGFSDIYLQEDKRDIYNLYIINSIDSPLNITSITTSPSSPSNLEIENISYPYTISSYQTRTAQIDLFADTVSSDYTNNFDIKVVGNYNNLTCEKTYNVKYKITNSDLPNTGSCNDIELLDNYFTIYSNQSKDIKLNIKNNSLDYYFEIDDIDIDYPNNSLITASVKNSIYRIFEDEQKELNVNIKSKESDFYKTEYLTLKIDGYLKRDNREDKRCRLNENISIRVSPETSSNSNECKNITINTRDISQLEDTIENYSVTDGFYLYNNSNKKFIITKVNYSDNSLYTNITSKSMNYDVFPKSSSSINFDLSTSNISSNISAKANLNFEGYFEDGTYCNYSDIKSNFNIFVIKKDDSCSQVGFVDSYFKEGENFITIYNKTNKDFSVNDVITQNNNSNVNIIDKAFLISKNSQKTIRVGVNGTDSFQLFLKGQFSDGKSCDYIQTIPGFFRFKEDYDFKDPSCDFIFNYSPVKHISLEGDFVDIFFNNLTNKSGSIKLNATGAVIKDPIIYFSSFQEISRRIDLYNINNPRNINYTIDVYGCSPINYSTELYPYSFDFVKDISFVTYTSSISSIKDRLLSSFTLKNNSLDNKEVEVRFSGFPSDFTFITNDSSLSLDLLNKSQDKGTITILSNSSKNIYFGVVIPSSANNIKYNGFIEVYVSGKLNLKEPFTIDREIKKEPLEIKHTLEKLNEKKNKVLLTLDIKNQLDVYRNIIISFDDENNFIINGDKFLTIDPFSSVSQSYNIEYFDINLLKYNIIDQDNNSVIFSGEIDLDTAKQQPSFLTGLLSFGSLKSIFFWIILILLILLIVYIIYMYRLRKKFKSKEPQPTLKLKEKEIIDDERLDPDIIYLSDSSSQKQLTLKELDNKN